MFAINRSPLHNRPLGAADRAALGEEGQRAVERLLALCPVHAPTPLVRLPALGASLGIGGLWVKDESHRLRLGSFKALGGAYAVIQHVLEAAAGQDVARADASILSDPAVREAAGKMTVACATDGNHGRAVAAGARLVGCKAVIFVPATVSSNRVDAIAGFGARIEMVEGGYDDAVAAASVQCRREGWTLVSDTASDGYEDTPLRIMQGYTVMAAEALREMPERPSHIFVQAGVGGMAGAVAAHVAIRFGHLRPKIVVVEPERAACVLAGHLAGRPVRVPDSAPTVMAMLDCHEASAVGARILARAADAFMTVGEAAAVAAMRALGASAGGDPRIVSGESGAAGLAGLMRASREPGLREALSIGAASRVLLFSTEGATDPDIYAGLTA